MVRTNRTLALLYLRSVGFQLNKQPDGTDLRCVMKLHRYNALLARDAALSVQRMREHFANGLEAAG